eukprot:TRINITY_DN4248_c0_g1_i1.p1 TRINITY_DN4248_c0_g1~~TRINITY_DN4248_c0_g1_i1.p1  ORF type:complete len:172 (-),score=17.44 TRINITY_DN4248_c0_g1_i1:96-554(-)
MCIRDRISDRGFSLIASNLHHPPLQEVIFGLSNTQITDDSILALSEALCQINTSISYFSLGIDFTAVTDKGFMSLIDTLLSCSNLSNLSLSFPGCIQITDLSGERLANLVRMHLLLSDITLDMQRSRITNHGAYQIRSLKSKRHKYFTVDHF